MKTKKNIVIFFTTVIILFFFAGCEKEHRNKYVGDWEFVTEKCTRKNNEIVKRDTVYYSGKISLGNSENSLIVQYTESDELEMYVDKDGTLSHYCGLGSLCEHGNFEGKNKVYFAIWDQGYINDVIGTKK